MLDRSNIGCTVVPHDILHLLIIVGGASFKNSFIAFYKKYDLITEYLATKNCSCGQFSLIWSSFVLNNR